MGTTLTGTTPQDTYDSLIKVTDNGPLSATAKYLSDGLGNDSALALSTSAVGIGTDTPGAPLDIVSAENVLVTITSTDAGAKIKLSDPDSDVFIQNQSSIFSLGFSATQGGQILHITSAGNVGIGTSSPATLLDVDGIAGAEGIKFPATQVPSADANTLDDYEQGTWTPVYAGSGGGSAIHNIQDGTYTKIGNLVTCSFRITAGKDTLSGDISITGLPFGTTIRNGIALQASRRFATDFVAFGIISETSLLLYKNDSSSTDTLSVTDADLEATLNYNDLRGAFSYLV